MSAKRVLIVGGGLAGLSLAIALRERRQAVSVVERARGWVTTGAGLYLVGAGTRALNAIGLAASAQGIGNVTRTQTLCTHRGARLAELDVDAYWARCGPCLGLERAVLHRVLAERVAGLPVRFGVTVSALRESGGEVEVRLTDEASEQYDLVVGADGIRSAVRRLALGGPPPRFRGQVGWRFLARRPPGIDGWTVYLGRSGAFLLLPIDGDRVYCYADRLVPGPIADPPTGRIERLRELFRRFAAPVREVLDQLDAPEQIHFAAIEEAAHTSWGQGSVLLIGDAAHAMSPNMACGAALAFEDALVLAELVAHAGAASSTSAGVLPEFRRRRAERVDWVRQQTNRRDRLRRLPPTLRDPVLRLLAERTYRANYRPLLIPP